MTLNPRRRKSDFGFFSLLTLSPFWMLQKLLCWIVVLVVALIMFAVALYYTLIYLLYNNFSI
jgi:hypothetical protein